MPIQGILAQELSPTPFVRDGQPQATSRELLTTAFTPAASSGSFDSAPEICYAKKCFEALRSR